MKIKTASGPEDDLAQLQALLGEPGLPTRIAAKIEHEIRLVHAGAKGEREATYEIDFHHGASRNWAVIHDLRIEHEGRVAQIDHLLISRFMELWVCETKHFAEGVAINDRGEFTRFYQGRPQAMPSPLEQNRKHLAVLEHILASDKITLPTRLGIALKPRLHAVVLVSKNARISRPTAPVAGADCIVKSDQFRSLIERTIDNESTMSSLMTMGRYLNSEALEAFARQIARLHRPLRRDWRAQFGLVSGAPVPAQPPAAQPPIARPPAAPAAAARGPAAPAGQPVLLSTSKLGASIGLPNVAATLECLRKTGYLEFSDGADHLTATGVAAGGQFVEKGRFAPYFLWPREVGERLEQLESADAGRGG